MPITQGPFNWSATLVFRSVELDTGRYRLAKIVEQVRGARRAGCSTEDAVGADEARKPSSFRFARLAIPAGGIGTERASIASGSRRATIRA